MEIWLSLIILHSCSQFYPWTSSELYTIPLKNAHICGNYYHQRMIIICVHPFFSPATSKIRQSQKTKGQMCSLISRCWSRVQQGVGKNEETLDWTEGNEGTRGVVGELRKVEWDRHYYPTCMYDYPNGVSLHHIQPKEWEVVLPCIKFVKIHSTVRNN